MLAAVVSLDPILHRLQDASVRGRTVFVVDHYGHIVAHPDTKNFVPGADLSDKSTSWHRSTPCPRNCATPRRFVFRKPDKNHPIEMIGTYSTFPEVNWAVVAQRSLNEARADAGVTELNRQALAFVSVVVLVAILFGYFFAVGISEPDSRPGRFHARHQPRRVSPAHAGSRRRGNQRARRKLQPHGQRHRGVHRAAERGRRRKSRAVHRLDPHARRGHRRKGSVHARSFRPRGEIFHV